MRFSPECAGAFVEWDFAEWIWSFVEKEPAFFAADKTPDSSCGGEDSGKSDVYRVPVGPVKAVLLRIVSKCEYDRKLDQPDYQNAQKNTEKCKQD